MADVEVSEALSRASSLMEREQWQNALLALRPVERSIGGNAEALFAVALCCFKVNDTQPARHFAVRARDEFRARDDTAGALRAMTLLGAILFETGNPGESYAQFAEALVLADTTDNPVMQAALHNNLGSLCSLRGCPVEASEHYAQALEVYEKLDNSYGAAETLHNLGITHRDLGEAEKAESFFERAAQTAQRVANHRLVAHALVARAELILQRGDLAMAERLARMAQIRADVHACVTGQSEAYKLLGTIARIQGHCESALELLDQALQRCTIHEGPLLAAETRVERALVLRELGQHESVRAELSAAIGVFEELGARAQTLRARQFLLEAQSTPDHSSSSGMACVPSF